jgi:hypothetical protein
VGVFIDTPLFMLVSSKESSPFVFWLLLRRELYIVKTRFGTALCANGVGTSLALCEQGVDFREIGVVEWVKGVFLVQGRTQKRAQGTMMEQGGV